MRADNVFYWQARHPAPPDPVAPSPSPMLSRSAQTRLSPQRIDTITSEPHPLAHGGGRPAGDFTHTRGAANDVEFKTDAIGNEISV
jgi:hypothetical protein